jgi:hypothetical protein
MTAHSRTMRSRGVPLHIIGLILALAALARHELASSVASSCVLLAAAIGLVAALASPA